MTRMRRECRHRNDGGGGLYRLASYTGMPVSTTRIALSSSVAGTMVVDGGGLQRKTVTSILMARVFTLPAAIILSGVLYWLSLRVFKPNGPDSAVASSGLSNSKRHRPDRRYKKRRHPGL